MSDRSEGYPGPAAVADRMPVLPDGPGPGVAARGFGAVFEVPAGDGPMVERVAAHLRGLVHAGALAAGERLPDGRDARWLARGFGRNTVYRAYRILQAEGLVDGRRSVGTFVRGVGAGARWDGRAVEVTLTVDQVGEVLLGRAVVARMPQGDLGVVVRLAR